MRGFPEEVGDLCRSDVEAREKGKAAAREANRQCSPQQCSPPINAFLGLRSVESVVAGRWRDRGEGGGEGG